jgi:Family of unknown function (DUF6518)
MTRLAPPPALPVRAATGFGTAIVLGVALGAAARLADVLGSPWFAIVPANAIGAWLALAFLVGAGARTIPTASLKGLVALAAAVVAYYALIAAFAGGFRAIGASHAALIWGAVAVIAGPILGAAGGAWRRGRGWPRAIALGLLAAALLAEGFVFGAPRLARVDQIAHDPAAFVFAAEMVVALVLPAALLLPGERSRGYAATLWLAGAAMLAIGPVTTIVRSAADRF